jgi:hypothetical protein
MANRTLIKNGTVVTMNDAGDVHFGGSVLLDGDRIPHRAGQGLDRPPDLVKSARAGIGPGSWSLPDARLLRLLLWLKGFLSEFSAPADPG